MNECTIFLKKRHVNVKVVVGRDCVQDDVARAGVSGDRFWVFGSNKNGSTFLFCKLFFTGSGRDSNNFVTKGFCDFDSHGS